MRPPASCIGAKLVHESSTKYWQQYLTLVVIPGELREGKRILGNETRERLKNRTYLIALLSFS